jgi:hypothetical protein
MAGHRPGSCYLRPSPSKPSSGVRHTPHLFETISSNRNSRVRALLWCLSKLLLSSSPICRQSFYSLRWQYFNIAYLALCALHGPSRETISKVLTANDLGWLGHLYHGNSTRIFCKYPPSLDHDSGRHVQHLLSRSNSLLTPYSWICYFLLSYYKYGERVARRTSRSCMGNYTQLFRSIWCGFPLHCRCLAK